MLEKLLKLSSTPSRTIFSPTISIIKRAKPLSSQELKLSSLDSLKDLEAQVVRVAQEDQVDLVSQAVACSLHNKEEETSS